MYYCKGIISIKKIIIILLLIITSSRAFSQGPYQHVNKAPRIKLDWGYKPKIYLVAGVKNIGGYLFRQSLMDIPKNHKDAISIGLKEAAKQGLAKLNCEIREEFEIFLNRPWEHKANPHFEIWIEYCFIQEYSPEGEPYGAYSDTGLHIIKIFPRAFTYKNGKCIHGVLLHELLHFAGFGENIAYACSHKAIPCAPLNPKYPKNCKCKKDDDHFPPTNPDGDMPDDNFSVASPNASNEIYESHNSDLLILRHGFYREAGALINRFKRGFSYIEPDQSPFEMKDPPPILFIPSGGLYGMEKSSQFKSILEDYVSQGGTVIVFAQQHGYDFSALPSPDELPLECYGWREDQSCHSNSMYVDTWHPALSSAARSLISSPIDGYFASYPSNSTVLLSRRINGMPAMLAYPYGEGRVVVTSMFEDWGNSHGQSTIQGRSIIRDLITWAKNPDLEIPEYNLRNNPDPELNLNLELENLSDKTASEAKILWLDPDRNLYFEEDKIISIHSRGKTIPENCIFSEVFIF